MIDATVQTDGARAAVRLERDLPDPPAVVWRALTEREQLRGWFPCDVIVAGGQWVVGAALSFPFPPNVIDMTLAGEVLAVEADRLLAYSWGPDTLRFELSPSGTGTHLVLINELAPGAAARNAAGWDECLDRLAGVEPADAWQARFDRYASMFAARLGTQEGPPAGYKGGDAATVDHG